MVGMDELACPKCSGAMVRPKRRRIPARKCGECRGVWLELDDLESHLPGPSILRQVLSRTGPPTALTCPTCHDQPLSCTEFKGHEIDWCSQCQGVFLDAGELDGIRRAMPKTTTSGSRRARRGRSALDDSVSLGEMAVDFAVHGLGELIVEGLGSVFDAL